MIYYCIAPLESAIGKYSLTRTSLGTLLCTKEETHSRTCGANLCEGGGVK
jgi:hypothetical protein